MPPSLLLLLLSLFSLSVLATTPRSDAKITSLPGLDTLPSFDMYSGYITLNATQRNMFYWFIEAAEEPEKKPLALWMQGGPGCSGLGGGLLQENGPFFVDHEEDSKKTKLVESFYSWNKEVNIIYVESPVGVGFSHGGGDFASDNSTAVENRLFLEGFYQLFPEYSNRPLFITGESYGGVYIPTLAYEIIVNNPSNSTLATNLKNGGLMLGNPVTGCDGRNFQGKDDSLALSTEVYNFYFHAMVSRRNFDKWNEMECNTVKPPRAAECLALYVKIREACGTFIQPLKKKEEDKFSRLSIPKINPDALYYSYCSGNVTLDFDTARTYDCFNIGDRIDAYLNLDAVQEAIHAKKTRWKECGGPIYRRNVGNLMPYLEQLFVSAPKMRILYYSGDIDIATVPFPQTQRCLETLKRPIVSEWRAWMYRDEIAGYVEEYDTYTFATIKGAGHEAPGYQPASSFLLFSSFINNKKLPSGI